MAEGIICRRGGGKIPDSILDVVTATTRTAITKNDPIEYRRYHAGSFSGAVAAVSNMLNSNYFRGDCITTANGTYFALPSVTSPYVYVYKIIGDTLSVISAGLTNCGSVVRGCNFTPDGTMLVAGTNSTLLFYSRSGDSFTYTGEAAYLAAFGARFSPDSQYLVMLHQSERPNVMKRSGNTFVNLGLMPAPGVVTNSEITDGGFTQDGTLFVGVYGTSGREQIQIWKRTGDVFAHANTIATGQQIKSVALSPDNQYLACGLTYSPFIWIGKRSGDTFVKLPNPATLPPYGAGPMHGIAFSKDGNWLISSFVPSGGYTNSALIPYWRSGDTFTFAGTPASPVPTGGCGRMVTSVDGWLFMIMYEGGTPAVIMMKLGAGDSFIVKMESSLSGKYLANQLYNYIGMGIALESAAAGASCKVALIKPINQTIAQTL